MTYIYRGTNNSDYFNYMGTDRLVAYGYSGNDRIFGNTQNDSIYGHDGNDSLYGWTGNDYLSGSSGNDYLSGGSGNDSLLGGSGNDSLVGGSGNDRLDGYATTGVEYDTLDGSIGSDTFVLGGSWGVSYQGRGYATIKNWDTSDWIEVRGSRSQYSLRSGNWGGSSATDMGIYYGSDLVGVVQDTTNVSMSRDFRFV
ncbi:calcium-binding protein [Leptolyngbya sp. NK1-12]|uniref:Calcium-binding protein n=1 Tax=Leptolyngbya sp. NK1-12 TaxID=2547451 RepID=A0AA97ANX2_9CYAN|nr:calcium-binding protein [Leptolyngbya sp. NK1-12]WNZ27242.1 calcium-binding protein [Leptolyngbya sp. NK1-12]